MQMAEVVEDLSAIRPLLSEEDQKKLDEGIETIVSIVEEEEIEIEFKCTGCGTLSDAMVKKSDVYSRRTGPLRAMNECRECRGVTEWRSTDITEVEIE